MGGVTKRQGKESWSGQYETLRRARSFAGEREVWVFWRSSSYQCCSVLCNTSEPLLTPRTALQIWLAQFEGGNELSKRYNKSVMTRASQTSKTPRSSYELAPIFLGSFLVATWLTWHEPANSSSCSSTRRRFDIPSCCVGFNLDVSLHLVGRWCT